MKLTFTCCLCPNDITTEIEMPEGWIAPAKMEESSLRTFCAEHAPINTFIKAQCPGCVGGWGSCGLWDAFAYSHKRSLTENDFTIIAGGKCPKRTNGTLMTVGGGISSVDLPEKADGAVGSLLVKAIKDYWVHYGAEEPTQV